MLAALLAEEHADLLLSYDSQGGNGHRDHVRVHQVGALPGTLANGSHWRVDGVRAVAFAEAGAGNRAPF